MEVEIAKEKSGNTAQSPNTQAYEHQAGTEAITGELDELHHLGYEQELKRNRSLLTLLFQSLAIAAIPYGEGSALISAIYGGGPLSIFVGWIVVFVLNQSIAMSLAELASRYPTSAGPYYWSFQIARSNKVTVSFINAWIWLIGNWTGIGPSLYRLLICTFANRYLPQVDIACATWTALTIIVVLIAVSVKAETARHSATYALSHYDKSFAGWGNFIFFIGLLPAAYVFSAMGMVSSMAEEIAHPVVQVPRAISLAIPVGAIAGLFFIIPITVTLPPLEDIINSPRGQALPYIFQHVMGSPGGGFALVFLVLIITLFCSISITVAASRATWAAARDDAIPLSSLWSRVHPGLDVPVWSLLLTTIIQMLLGLINLGSSSAFTAFASVGVIALAVAYAEPITLSLWHGRKEVSKAPWNCGPILGTAVNVIALAWIVFELVLFSMPTALPVTASSMNYASVVFVGFMVISAVWYAVYARKHYKGPPETDAL